MTVLLLDHTALAALGGNRELSRIVREAHSQPDWLVYVPALCLAVAASQRPVLARHIGALGALHVVDLGYAAATAVGHLIADGVDWPAAHAAVAARPDAEWPTGRPVVTALPQVYARLGATTITLR